MFLLPPSSCNATTRYELLELSRFLAELSVIDYFFVSQRPSIVALAAIANALELLPGVSEELFDDLMAAIGSAPGIDVGCPELEECRNRLRLLYAQGGYAPPGTIHEDRTLAVSPVCVSYGVNPHEAGYQGAYANPVDAPTKHPAPRAAR